MNYLPNVITNIKNGKNSIFYKTNIYPYYNYLKESYNCVYLSEPLPVKAQLIKILEKLTHKKVTSTNNKTIPFIKETIIKKLKYQKLVVLLNHFEKLTKAVADVYNYLNHMQNIVFIANVKEHFQKEIYFFFKKFIIINKKDYENVYRKDEINVTYALYLVLSLLCFFIYIKFALSAYNQTIFLPVMIIGGVWFAFLVFRTLIFTGGKV